MAEEIAEVKRRVLDKTLRLVCDDIGEQEQELIGEKPRKVVPDPANTNCALLFRGGGTRSQRSLIERSKSRSNTSRSPFRLSKGPRILRAEVSRRPRELGTADNERKLQRRERQVSLRPHAVVSTNIGGMMSVEHVTEQTIKVGVPSVIQAPSPHANYGVVFDLCAGLR